MTSNIANKAPLINNLKIKKPGRKLPGFFIFM